MHHHHHHDHHRRRGGRGAAGAAGALAAMLAGQFGRGGGRGFGAAFGPGGFSFDWGGPPPGGRGPGRGRRRMFDGGELRLVLLRLIADEPRHGYDLIRAIEEMTHGAYAPSPGVVYPTLTMLQDMGQIEEAPAEGTRKQYRVTADGEAALADRADEIEALMERLGGAGEDRRRAGGGAPIKRAVGNLMAAIWHRLSAGEADEAALHEIAEILDDAARRIERLKGGA